MRQALLLLGLFLLSWQGTAEAQAPMPSFRFVAASINAAQGDRALDQDSNTAWIGIARRTPAWYIARLDEPMRLAGVVVATAKMPASTYYRIEASGDGLNFHAILENLRNEDDAPIMRSFTQDQDVSFLRLVFENGSRQPFIAFALRELAPVPVPAPLGELPASSTAFVPAPQPSSPPARLLGAVLGTYEGRRALVLVGDNLNSPIDLVQVEGHGLKVIDKSSTQILCDYPYARTPRMSLTVSLAGRRLTRTVAVVHREIRWPPVTPRPGLEH